MKVYRVTDRIPVRIGELTFWVSPLTFEQRSQIGSIARIEAGKEVPDPLKTARALVGQSLKQVDGLFQGDDSPFELEFDDMGALTSDCVEDLLQLDGVSDKLVGIAGRFVRDGIKEVTDIPGVTVDLKAVKSLKKSPSVKSDLSSPTCSSESTSSPQ